MRAPADMLFEENRLASFTSWIFNSDQTCNAAKMAEAGFYFTGNEQEPDLVNCFLCDKALDGWESDDDPWSEHLKHSTNCSFAKLQSPQSALTYEQHVKIEKEYLLLCIDRDYKRKTKEVQDVFECARNALNESITLKERPSRVSKKH